MCGIGYHLIFGENILHSVLENAKDGDLLALYGSSHGIGLYIWMYGTYILVCKEVVLLVGLLSELLLMRIPLRYRSGKNAVTFVGFYYLFCQNAGYLSDGSRAGDSPLRSDAQGSGVAFQR